VVHYQPPLALSLAGMNADPPQHTRERHLFSNHRQRSTRLPQTNEPNITRDIYPSRTSPMAREGMLNSPNPSDVLANANAAFTENAVVVVSNEKGIVTQNW
jgi:hypothetical protein